MSSGMERVRTRSRCRILVSSSHPVVVSGDQMKLRDEDALEYHSAPPPGKIAVRATKPCLTQRDLSLAYTPGVAVPCLEIERDPALVYKYTAKGNLVAVVQRIRGAGTRQYRSRSRQTGDGRQGSAVQAF